jgi:hypothetical protein
LQKCAARSSVAAIVLIGNLVAPIFLSLALTLPL